MRHLKHFQFADTVSVDKVTRVDFYRFVQIEAAVIKGVPNSRIAFEKINVFLRPEANASRLAAVVEEGGLRGEDNSFPGLAQAETVIDVIILHAQICFIEAFHFVKDGLGCEHACRRYGGDIPRRVA